MHMLFIIESKSCEISNQTFLKFFECFHFRKQNTNSLCHKYCKIKLYSGTISHGASNEPETYLEPSHRPRREHFCRNI